KDLRFPTLGIDGQEIEPREASLFQQSVDSPDLDFERLCILSVRPETGSKTGVAGVFESGRICRIRSTTVLGTCSNGAPEFPRSTTGLLMQRVGLDTEHDPA